YRASTLERLAVYSDTPDAGQGGGIWQAGQGLASTNTGDLYFATGNGSFSGNVGGRDFADSVVRLDATSLSVVDWFTPFNQADMAAGDGDLGSSGPLLIPRTTALLTGDKFGDLFLLDRNRLGHFNAAGDTQILQKLSLSRFIYGSPIYWDSPAGPRIYVWPSRESLREYAMTGGLLQPAPVATNAGSNPTFGGFLS